MVNFRIDIDEHTVFDDSPNQRPLDHLFAIISVDADGNEGICGAFLPSSYSGGPGSGVPMITSSPEVLEEFKTQARKMLPHTDKKLKVVRFTVREDVETIE